MLKAYLDNHSLTQPSSFAMDSLLYFYREKWSEEPWYDYENATAKILETLGAKEESVWHFCSSGAEAINRVFFSHQMQTVRKTGQNHLIAPQIASAPILLSMQRMEEWGCATKLLAVNHQGQITKQVLLQSVRPRTGLLSIPWAEGLTGVIQPVADLAEVCAEKNIALHIDGSCVLGKLYLRLEDIPIDYFTFDGRLLHAPHGTAGLITKKKVLHAPLVIGEDAPPMALMAALTKAVIENASSCDHVSLETARLRDKLEREIKRAIPQAVVFFDQVERLPNCTAIGFPGASGEALLYLLNRSGVYATIGGGTRQRVSHVLIASGIDPILAESAISFSLSVQTSEAEIDYAIESIIASFERLKTCSHCVMKD